MFYLVCTLVIIIHLILIIMFDNYRAKGFVISMAVCLTIVFTTTTYTFEIVDATYLYAETSSGFKKSITVRIDSTGEVLESEVFISGLARGDKVQVKIWDAIFLGASSKITEVIP